MKKEYIYKMAVVEVSEGFNLMGVVYGDAPWELEAMPNRSSVLKAARKTWPPNSVWKGKTIKIAGHYGYAISAVIDT